MKVGIWDFFDSKRQFWNNCQFFLSIISKFPPYREIIDNKNRQYMEIFEIIDKKFSPYRVSFNSLRTLWALLNIKNEGKCSSKSYRFKEEGCDFHSQLLFFSYVEANVFYSPWHLKLLKHEISSWSYICPSVKKINIHPTVSLFWLYAHSCVIAQKLPQNTQFLKNIDTRIKTILKLSTL